MFARPERRERCVGRTGGSLDDNSAWLWSTGPPGRERCHRAVSRCFGQGSSSLPAYHAVVGIRRSLTCSAACPAAAGGGGSGGSGRVAVLSDYALMRDASTPPDWSSRRQDRDVIPRSRSSYQQIRLAGHRARGHRPALDPDPEEAVEATAFPVGLSTEPPMSSKAPAGEGVKASASARLPTLEDQTPTWHKAAALARARNIERLAARLDHLAASGSCPEIAGRQNKSGTKARTVPIGACP